MIFETLLEMVLDVAAQALISLPPILKNRHGALIMTVFGDSLAVRRNWQPEKRPFTSGCKWSISAKWGKSLISIISPDAVFVSLSYLPRTLWPQSNFRTFREICSYVYYSSDFFSFFFSFVCTAFTRESAGLSRPQRKSLRSLFSFHLYIFTGLYGSFPPAKNPKTKVFFLPGCYLSGSG